jgi:hypothetical protein
MALTAPRFDWFGVPLTELDLPNAREKEMASRFSSVAELARVQQELLNSGEFSYRPSDAKSESADAPIFRRRASRKCGTA